MKSILIVLLCVISLIAQEERITDYYYYNKVTISPDVTPPGVPQNLLATGAVLTWDANTEPDLYGYVVYRDSLGAELVTNGGFTDATGWLVSAGWMISGGLLNSDVPDFASDTYQDIGLVNGAKYRVELDYVVNSGQAIIQLGAGNLVDQGNTTGHKSLDVTCIGNSSFYITGWAPTFVGTFDNVSIKRIFTTTSLPDIPIDTVLAGTETYEDLTATTNNYRIRALDIAGNLSDYSNSVSNVVPSFSPSDLDSLTNWLNETTLWTDRVGWGDTSLFTGAPDFKTWAGGSFGQGVGTRYTNQQFFRGVADGNTNFLNATTVNGVFQYNNFTVFVIDSPLINSGSYQAQIGISDAGNRLVRMLTNITTGTQNAIVRDADGNIFNVATDSVVWNKWGIKILRWNALTKTGDLWVSGQHKTQTLATFVAGQVYNGYNEAGIFGYTYGATPSYPHHGGIGEVIIYRGALSDVNVEKVAQYLATKWGVYWNGVY